MHRKKGDYHPVTIKLKFRVAQESPISPKKCGVVKELVDARGLERCGCMPLCLLTPETSHGAT